MHSCTWGTNFKWPVHFLLLFSLFSWDSGRSVRAFTFDFDVPGQCDPLNISWTGGTPPFSLLIAPLFRNFLNISLPSSTYDAESQTGSFSTQLSFPEGQRFLLSMSDASGFGTGGISSVLTTGASATNSVCDTTLNAVPAFTFALPDQLQQCSEFVFDGYSNSTQPNTIRGLIPLGQSVTLVTDPKTDQFTWQANVASGTSMVFIITDSLGRGGGTSDVESVSESSNAACLNEQSPHSTASSATMMTAIPTATSQPSPITTSQSTSSGVNTGTIAGIAIGVVAILLLGILLTTMLVRRHKHHVQNVESASTSQIVQFQNAPATNNLPQMAYYVPTSNQEGQPSVDLVNYAISNAPYSTYRPSSLPLSATSGQSYQQGVYQSPIVPVATDGQSNPTSVAPIRMLPNPHPQSASYSDVSHYRSQSDSSYLSNLHQQQQASHEPASTNLPSKVTPPQTARRLVLHTDADDSGESAEDRVLELPPQYSDRRDPLSEPPPSGKPVIS